jgi:hypothetical protein
MAAAAAMSAGREYGIRTEGLDVRAIELARVVASGAAVAVTATSLARAAEPCAKVLASSHLGPAWVAAVEELRRQLADLPTSDCRSMTIALEPSGGVLRVLAAAPDGRRTERTASRPDDLVPTVLGLLIAIPAGPAGSKRADPNENAGPAGSKRADPNENEGPARSKRADPNENAGPTDAAAEDAPAAPAASAALPAAPEAPLARARPAVVASRTIALWTGLSAGVRLTAPTDLMVLDVEARADLLLYPWLLTATIRSAVASCAGQQGVDCDVYNDVSAGVGVGRRFAAGAAAIDLALEPSIVVMHMEYDYPGGFEGALVEGTEVALRVDTSARLAVPLGPSWALTVTVDGGLAPAMLVSPSQLAVPGGAPPGSPAPPPFPAWMGGVRVGASGALL